MLLIALLEFLFSLQILYYSRRSEKWRLPYSFYFLKDLYWILIVSAYGCAHLNACIHRDQICWCIEIGVIRTCEPPNICAGIWIWDFWKIGAYFTTELFLQDLRFLRLLAIYLYIMVIFVSWSIDTKIVSERRYTIMVTDDKDGLNYIVLAYYFLMYWTFFPSGAWLEGYILTEALQNWEITEYAQKYFTWMLLEVLFLVIKNWRSNQNFL